jgi:molybdopterin-guanine dinucleotide biosynthesis protein A
MHPKPEYHRLGAVILCGGRSLRMGYPKWRLPLDGQSLLERIIDTVAIHASPIALSFNEADQPALAKTAAPLIVCDQYPDCGPIEGIRACLRRLESECDAAFVTACDVPLLKAPLIALLYSLLSDDYDAVIPVDGRHIFGLTAVYRCGSHKKIEQLVREGKLRVSLLSDALRTRLVSMQEIRSVDKNADSLKNINDPEDYFSLLTELGLDCPAELRSMLHGLG